MTSLASSSNPSLSTPAPSSTVIQALKQLQLPAPDSYKGQNGKLLIIGGSELFHAASKWSLDVASKFVDMVFYASVPENNALVREAKGNFWNGIVISREDVAPYVNEADVVLIGPGMTRSDETKEIVSTLLTTHPQKKWVIDAGALQMVDPHLFSASMIVTPHHQELKIMWENFLRQEQTSMEKRTSFDWSMITPADLQYISRSIGGATIVLKGMRDIIASPALAEEIAGGNAGMTKGGTGDVLAGLIAALYCTQSAMVAAVLGSYVNKQAGDTLFTEVGPYFNASDLVEKIPQVIWKEHQRVVSAPTSMNAPASSPIGADTAVQDDFVPASTA